MNSHLCSFGQRWVVIPIILAASLPASRATGGSPGEVHIAAASRPQVFFACCGDISATQTLLADGSVIASLQRLNAGVAIGIDDLSPARAQIVQRFNGAGIPVVASFVVPGAQGYYLNSGNAAQAAAHFAAFQEWTTQNRLRWSAIGLDIEPDIRLFDDLQHHRIRLAASFLARYFEFAKMRRARNAYSDLIRRMQSQGYVVQTYQLPLIVAERNANVTLLERLLGIVDVRGDEEVVMIYTSFNKAIGSAMIWMLGPDAQKIAIGITNGGKYGLNWDEFSRDLIVAAHFSDTVGVFNLEGSVERHFLFRLQTLDWHQTISITPEAIAKAHRLYMVVVIVLWLSELAPWLLVALVLAFAWTSFRISLWLKAHPIHKHGTEAR